MPREDCYGRGYLNVNAPARSGPNKGKPLHPKAPKYKGHIEFDKDCAFRAGEKVDLSCWVQSVSEDDPSVRLDANGKASLRCYLNEEFVPEEREAPGEADNEDTLDPDDDIPF